MHIPHALASLVEFGIAMMARCKYYRRELNITFAS